MLKRVHHINFVVHDLQKAITRYEKIFGVNSATITEHSERPVITARFKVGESWIVLIQPRDKNSAPARHLAQYGEGFYLISYEVDDIESAINHVRNNGGNMLDQEPRKGILNWQVADLEPETTFNALTQLVEEK